MKSYRETGIYKVDPETLTIRDLGKFEGCQRYAPAVWDRVLDGASDLILDPSFPEYPIDVILVDAELTANYPELIGVHCIAIWETDQGFIYTTTLDQGELSQLETDLRTETETNKESENEL